MHQDVGLNVNDLGGGGMSSGKGSRPISPNLIQCGISDEDLVTLSVRDLNRQLKMRGLTRDEIVSMKQRLVIMYIVYTMTFIETGSAADYGR